MKGILVHVVCVCLHASALQSHSRRREGSEFTYTSSRQKKLEALSNSTLLPVSLWPWPQQMSYVNNSGQAIDANFQFTYIGPTNQSSLVEDILNSNFNKYETIIFGQGSRRRLSLNAAALNAP